MTASFLTWGRLGNSRRSFLFALLSMASPLCVAQTAVPGACREIPNSQTCIDATPCKPDSSGVTICLAGVTLPAGAISVPQTCWQYSYQFACTTASVNTCATYQNNPLCTAIASRCQDTVAETGQCDAWNTTYQCQTQAAQTTQQLSCSSGLFNTATMPTPSNPNNTFSLAAVTQEVLREAQVYSQGGQSLFTGVAENCSKGYLGLENCCKSSPGAKSNAAVSELVLSSGFSVAKYAGENAVDFASPYVFDAMYQSGLWNAELTSEFALADGTQGTSLASSGLSLSAYGFTYSTGTFEAGSGLMDANTELASFGNDGFVEFNPYVFAAEIAITIIEDLMSCSSEEQMLAMHRGANLSAYIDEHCSRKVPVIGTCIQWTDDYCSFNSVLAAIINMQGKAQLGLDTSHCGGLTTEQLSQIDFTRIDFSAFTQSVVNKATNNLPTSAAINQAYTSILQTVPHGSAQSNTSSVLPSVAPPPSTTGP